MVLVNTVIGLLSTDKGINLYDPETLSENNLSFLVYLLAMIEAVDRYAPALRATTATSGNDYRLGGHEAPPAIISIFLGEQLENILENIENITSIIIQVLIQMK